MATTEEHLVTTMRRKIVYGELSAGSRLPNRTELREQFDVSSDTLQKGIDRLVREGFLDVGARKLGTRVVEHPPHLHHYRVIFPHDADLQWTFWRAMYDAAVALDAGGDDRAVSLFYGMSGHRGVAEYQAVLEEVQTDRVAGLIFASSANELLETPLMTWPNIPRAAVALEHQLPGIPKVAPDYDSFFAQALACLKARGCRRIGMVAGAPGRVMRAFHQQAEAAKLKVNPLHVQFASHQHQLGAERLIGLLLQSKERPDGLILADDNILEGAARGIHHAGLRVPHDLQVVALANFPNASPAPLPFVRIGFDVPQMLSRLVALIDAQRRGDPVPLYQSITATTENPTAGA